MWRICAGPPQKQAFWQVFRQSTGRDWEVGAQNCCCTAQNKAKLLSPGWQPDWQPGWQAACWGRPTRSPNGTGPRSGSISYGHGCGYLCRQAAAPPSPASGYDAAGSGGPGWRPVPANPEIRMRRKPHHSEPAVRTGERPQRQPQLFLRRPRPRREACGGQ